MELYEKVECDWCKDHGDGYRDCPRCGNKGYEYRKVDMNHQVFKIIRHLCRYIANNVTMVRKGKRNYCSLCSHCPIPKYRNEGWRKCPAADMKHACSTELIRYFTRTTDEA